MTSGIELVKQARLLIDTGAIYHGETVNYPGDTIIRILDLLEPAIALLGPQQRDMQLRIQNQRAEINRLTAKNAELRASEEGALMILTQTIAERDAARGKLKLVIEEMRKAANRVEWCAGIIIDDGGRDRAFGWVDEMRAAIAEIEK